MMDHLSLVRIRKSQEANLDKTVGGTKISGVSRGRAKEEKINKKFQTKYKAITLSEPNNLPRLI